MGHPVDFKGSNKLLGPPRGSDNVYEMNVFCNGVACVSCWELTPSEKEEIARTGRVFISVFSGYTQPPVFVGGEEQTRSLIADYGVWKK